MDASKLENFDFELVSPERKLMSQKAWQVTIPGYEGDFGVRAGHASLVSSIRQGVVEIKEQENAAPIHIFIAGGFADVTATNCTILAEEAIMVSDLNATDIEKEITEAQAKLSASQNGIEKNRYQNQINLLNEKLVAITNASAA